MRSQQTEKTNNPFPKKWCIGADLILNLHPTGIVDDKQTQPQNYVIPANLSDPFLCKWVKPDNNPLVVADESINKTKISDPTTAWLGQDRCWRELVDSLRNPLVVANESINKTKFVGYQLYSSQNRYPVVSFDPHKKTSAADPNASFLQKIDKCFSQDTVEEIIEALEREAAESHDEWCNTALNKIKEASPLSLKVALKSIREGRFQPLDQCLVREYRISVNWVSKRMSDDFCEGVRARLVDKDFAPKWDPTRLEKVTTDMVDRFFIPLDELEPELNLATAIREPSM
ncbi:hypothetical protein H5410_053343 [Solanum commersonii]|uniref:3-hydroxyisobutyryl-CoA hydrolase n=1 Tax=Solanum commersonii TaxID=4109 RepID=A0A9J5X609_SOLCO|nr:hypothetical protein H5410_053343 [Solanum commersonii]